jgi:hypothetical protein
MGTDWYYLIRAIFLYVLCMFELVYVLEDHFHILVIYCMDLWEINKYEYEYMKW